jgi:hypothetical protein
MASFAAIKPILSGNECDAVIRSVPATELQRTFTEMELTLDLSSAVCPHCGAVNLFPGFSQILAFTCKECGEVAKLSDNPDMISNAFSDKHQGKIQTLIQVHFGTPYIRPRPLTR